MKKNFIKMMKITSIIIGAIFLIVSTAIFSYYIPDYEEKIADNEQIVSDVLGFWQIKNTIYLTTAKSIIIEEGILKEINPESTYLSETSKQKLNLKLAQLNAIFAAAYGRPFILVDTSGKTINISKLDKESADKLGNKIDEEIINTWAVIESNNSYAKTILDETTNLKKYKSDIRSKGIILQTLGLILVTVIPNLLEYRSK